MPRPPPNPLAKYGPSPSRAALSAHVRREAINENIKSLGGSLAASAIYLARRRARNGQCDCADFLYRFNTFPRSWAGPGGACDSSDWLLTSGLGSHPGLLSQFHKLYDAAGESKDWSFWSRIDETNSRPRITPCPKLYLGVSPNHLVIALERIAKYIFDVPPTAIKFPTSRNVALRPDKLIFYFDSFADLERCAEIFSIHLPKTLECQAVPFTKQVENCKFLFTAADPVGGSEEKRGLSWRSAVTHHLDICINRILPGSDAGISSFLSEVSDAMSEFGFNVCDWGTV